MVWDNGLYSVSYILNKHWLASGQAGSIGGTIRQEVEVSQWEQENSRKEEAHSLGVLAQLQDVTALLKKVLNHVANIY